MSDSPNNNKLIVYGAGGHGQVVAEAAAAAGFDVLGFVDDDRAAGERVGQLRVLDKASMQSADAAVIVAIGHNATRLSILNQLRGRGLTPGNVVHPSAVVSPSAQLGRGVFIGPNAVVNAQAQLGDGVIVNSGAVVEHHCVLEAGAHAAPRSVLGGAAQVGPETLLGLGAVVLPIKRVGSRCVVGAGAVVTHDVPDDLTVAGNPARKLG